MAPLPSIFDDGRWLSDNDKAVGLLVDLVGNAIDDREYFDLSDRFCEDAAVSTTGGGV